VKIYDEVLRVVDASEIPLTVNDINTELGRMEAKAKRDYISHVCNRLVRAGRLWRSRADRFDGRREFAYSTMGASR
jgi:predicted transcriptional regulator